MTLRVFTCRRRIISLMYNRDAPLLTEVCRLIHTVLAFDDYRSLWIDEIQFQMEFFENLLFILSSSTNGRCKKYFLQVKTGHLLIGAVRLLDIIMRLDDSLAEIWCGPLFLDAILIAQHQMEYVFIFMFTDIFCKISI